MSLLIISQELISKFNSMVFGFSNDSLFIETNQSLGLSRKFQGFGLVMVRKSSGEKQLLRNYRQSLQL